MLAVLPTGRKPEALNPIQQPLSPQTLNLNNCEVSCCEACLRISQRRSSLRKNPIP